MKQLAARRSPISVLLLSVVFICGCHHQVATAPASQPLNSTPPPTITLQASPSAIMQGGSSTLTWSSSNTSQVRLYPEIGGVPTQGARTVSPSESTVYTAMATGPNGEATATASVTVSLNSSVHTAPSTPNPSLEQLFQQNIVDVYFDYDQADLGADARNGLTRDGEFLRSHPGIKFTIEGHCDERGGEEYNLALGSRRATSAEQFLVSLGLPIDRIQTISLGKERPFCAEENESCYRQNRRAHFVMAQ